MHTGLTFLTWMGCAQHGFARYTWPNVASSPIPAPSLPAALLRDVSHLYGGAVVLRHLNATLQEGRCYLLLGPNGAGKSTLLRILAGLLRPTFGTVELWGGPPEDGHSHTGYMSHEPMLYEEFTGAENLRYFAALYAPQPCLGPTAAMAAVELDPALTRPVRAYSQGMRQRLSLARVLLSQPKLLLLDEPFSNMDAQSSQAMLRLLARERDRGCTLVLTTHQRELAEPLADELLVLEAGELRQSLPNRALQATL